MVLFICFIFATQRKYFIFFFLSFWYLSAVFAIDDHVLRVIRIDIDVWMLNVECTCIIRFGVRVNEVNSCAKTSASFIHELKVNQIAFELWIIFDWNHKRISKLMKWISRDPKSMILFWRNDIVCSYTSHTTHIMEWYILYAFHFFGFVFCYFLISLNCFKQQQHIEEIRFKRRRWQESEKCSFFISFCLVCRLMVTSMKFWSLVIGHWSYSN